MWSRKPTPVWRLPAPLPSSPSSSAMSVSPVRRCLRAVRGSLIDGAFSPTRASIDSACTTNPSARAIGAPAAASAAAASPMCTSLMRRRNWRGDRPEAKRAEPPVGRLWFEPAT